MIGKMAAQQIRGKVTSSREIRVRGRKWIGGHEHRPIGLVSSVAEVRIDDTEGVAERLHRWISTRIRRWLAAGVEQGPPRGRAERNSAIETAGEIPAYGEMADEPASCLRARLRLERAVRVIEASEDRLRQRE